MCGWPGSSPSCLVSGMHRRHYSAKAPAASVLWRGSAEDIREAKEAGMRQKEEVKEEVRKELVKDY